MKKQERREKRIALALTANDYERLATFAKVIGKLPAVAARNILVDFLDNHAQDIATARQAAVTYQAALKNLSKSSYNISLFEEAH